MKEQIKIIMEMFAMRGSYAAPFFRWALVITLIISVTSLIFANMLVSERVNGLQEEVHKRMQVQASAKARIMETWLKGKERLGDHIIQGDMVRLFASEVNSKGYNDKSLQAQLVAQLPYMRQMLKEFIAQHGLEDAFMVNEEGHVYLSGTTKSGDLLTPAQETGVRMAFSTGETQFLPIKQIGVEYVLEIVRPVMSLDNSTPQVTSAFVMLLPIKSSLHKIMKPGNFDRMGEKGYLFQKVGSSTWYVNLTGPVALKPIYFSGLNPTMDAHDSPVTNKKVFAYSVPVEGTHFISSYEYNENAALSEIQEYKNTIYTFIGLGMIAIIAVILSVVWYMLGQRNRHRVKTQEQAIDALVRTVEIRDPYLSGHHQRVAQLALKMSNQMKMPVKDRSTLYYAALLSGVGKIFIPQNILTKPGKLTDDERSVMENHVNHALNILGDIDFEFPVASVIQQMCERCDGSGYPNKVAGKDINKLSRILGICDVFCALTSPRAYRTRKTEAEALKLMLDEKGKYDTLMLTTLKSICGHKAQQF
jgi:HD-GYP domain-containing protein (c-di-GMP phosphodiesterase class II)